MKNKNTLLVLSIAILFTYVKSASSYAVPTKKARYNIQKKDAVVTVSKGIDYSKLRFTPITDSTFIGFKEALAFKESRGNYNIVNTLGHIGKYQFGKSTLSRLRIYNTHDFLNNPKLQEQAFTTLCSLNKWILIRDINRSVGKKINGIEITESGILAAAHLAGAGNVKIYLRSNGARIFYDAYGSDVQQYMRLFAGFDTSIIKPIKNATI